MEYRSTCIVLRVYIYIIYISQKQCHIFSKSYHCETNHSFQFTRRPAPHPINVKKKLNTPYNTLATLALPCIPSPPYPPYPTSSLHPHPRRRQPHHSPTHPMPSASSPAGRTPTEAGYTPMADTARPRPHRHQQQQHRLKRNNCPRGETTDR